MKSKILDIVCTIIGVIGGWIATIFGGWDAGMVTLVIFMIIDYIAGLVVAGIFKQSKKHPEPWKAGPAGKVYVANVLHCYLSL